LPLSKNFTVPMGIFNSFFAWGPQMAPGLLGEARKKEIGAAKRRRPSKCDCSSPYMGSRRRIVRGGVVWRPNAESNNGLVVSALGGRRSLAAMSNYQHSYWQDAETHPKKK
jgi:hypothetical protein